MQCQDIQAGETGTRYLRGELSGPERDAYEVHYFECERCFTELEALRLMQAGLARQAAAIRAEPLGSRWGWLWIAAPALAGLALLGFFLMPPSPPAAVVVETAKTEAKKPASPLVALARYEAPAYREAYLRGADTTPRFRQAMSAYRAQDYASAMKALRTAGPDARTLFFLAASELLNGEAAAAQSTAARVIAAGETPYLEEAYFLRAKANLALNDAAAATADLEKLVALEGDWAAHGRTLLNQVRAAVR